MGRSEKQVRGVDRQTVKTDRQARTHALVDATRVSNVGVAVCDQLITTAALPTCVLAPCRRFDPHPTALQPYTNTRLLPYCSTPDLSPFRSQHTRRGQYNENTNRRTVSGIGTYIHKCLSWYQVSK